MEKYPTLFIPENTAASDLYNDALELREPGTLPAPEESSTDLLDLLEWELEMEAMRPEPHYAWPEANPDGTVSEETYSAQLTVRASDVGRELDDVRPYIDSDAKAEEWFEFKKAVAATKSMNDPYEKVNVVIELEKASFEFTQRISQT